MRRSIGALALVLLPSSPCKKAPPGPPPGTLPQSGFYDVRYEVTAWDCNAAKPAPITAKRVPVMTTRDGGGTILHANVWNEETAFSSINAAAQADLLLRRGEKRTTTEQPVWNCGARMEDTFETEVTEVSHEQLRLKVRRVYGDMSICQQPRARAESRCRAEASVVFTLVESKCELPSTGRMHFTSSGSTEMVCYQAL